MGMLVSNLTVPSHTTLLLVIGIIKAAAIIGAAAVIGAAAIIEVAVTEVYTIPREAVLMPDAARATPGRGPIPGILPIPAHLRGIPAGPNLHLDLTEGIHLIHAVEAGPDHLKEGMAITPEVIMAWSLQITNTLDMASRSPKKN